MVHWSGMNIAILSKKGSPLADFMSASGSWECVAGQCLAVVPESHFSTLYFSFPQSTLFWGEKGSSKPKSSCYHFLCLLPFLRTMWMEDLSPHLSDSFSPQYALKWSENYSFESNWSLLLVFPSAAISWDYVSGQVQAGEAFPPCWWNSYTSGPLTWSENVYFESKWSCFLSFCLSQFHRTMWRQIPDVVARRQLPSSWCFFFCWGKLTSGENSSSE